MSLRSEPEFAQLARLAGKLRLSESSFQSIVFGLGPQQRRLFLLLAEEGVASTIEVRTRCSIGNVADVAASLSARLEAFGDPRRVVCELRPHENAHGDRGRIGWWRLVTIGAAANDATAPETATA